MNRYRVPAVTQAIQIIDYLCNNKSKSLTEISKELDINKSSCMRLLKTLEEEKVVSYEPETKKYRLGPLLVVWGNNANEQIDYISIAQTHLDKLFARTSLTCALVYRMSSDKMVNIAKREIQGDLNIGIQIGRQFQITESSYGKTLLAFSSKEEQDYFINKGLKEITERTETNPASYRKDLEKIKNNGFCVSIGEYTQVTNIISAPVFNSQNEVIMVLACIGFTSIMTEEDIKDASEIVKQVAAEFTMELAGNKNNHTY